MSDILKKPVHVALLRPAPVQHMAAAGTFKQTPYGLDPALPMPVLPKETKAASTIPRFEKPTLAVSSISKQTKRQVQLKVLHDLVPAPSPTPPCATCKTSACCKAFVVNITEQEYESGLYGDAAVKITPEIAQQLHSRFLAVAMLGAPVVTGTDTAYYFEGKLGEACPFLDDHNRCRIYDIRPITCRSYGCVEDPRITDALREGTEEIDMLTLSRGRRNAL